MKYQLVHDTYHKLIKTKQTMKSTNNLNYKLKHQITTIPKKNSTNTENTNQQRKRRHSISWPNFYLLRLNRCCWICVIVPLHSKMTFRPILYKFDALCCAVLEFNTAISHRCIFIVYRLNIHHLTWFGQFIYSRIAISIQTL